MPGPRPAGPGPGHRRDRSRDGIRLRRRRARRPERRRPGPGRRPRGAGERNALAACGRRDQAAAQVQAAQAVFESCGAGPYARKAASLRRRIAARGSRGQPGTGNRAGSTALSALTRREQQVASLVSQGLTNRRIAQRLHVTDKTIEMHLSNIFAKLGVSSRTETAAAVIWGHLPAHLAGG
jgi:DNA-binding NarL/FixJ family response regulator